ncbi:ABC transporter permease [Rhabdaerophilum sp. SD176]|uniref:ABC transporter permease n=1 Tax=Rhabdaerophilum sp. SD176 TaxID=2983548 RepID=UPI0024DFB06D|nr:ABC transporter permease [Rhabdaerophilum sp. SD176]
MEMLPFILATVFTAATPLLIAALGEHVTERAGVLNLGVEGMMIVGAATGFAAAVLTDSSVLGILAGALAGMALSAVFALMVLVFATNQVATGLALTIMGLGLAGLIGQGFVGQPRAAIPPVKIPLLSEIPVLGKAIFTGDFVFFLSLALIGFVAWGLNRSRFGLLLRAVGESHGSAHALGLPVKRIRLVAILFGGLLAGLAGAYLSLIYTRFWSPGMSAGRGWIALALVVFAAGHVWRLVLGAYLFGGITVAQLHAQAGAIGLPSQFLSALPYLMTIAALLFLSISGRKGAGAAGSLGQPFVPER